MFNWSLEFWDVLRFFLLFVFVCCGAKSSNIWIVHGRNCVKKLFKMLQAFALHALVWATFWPLCHLRFEKLKTCKQFWHFDDQIYSNSGGFMRIPGLNMHPKREPKWPKLSAELMVSKCSMWFSENLRTKADRLLLLVHGSPFVGKSWFNDKRTVM